MNFFVVWAIVLGIVVGIAGAVGVIRLLVLWLETRPRLRLGIAVSAATLATTAYISLIVWSTTL